MGEKPREEILVQPEFSLIIFGDAYNACVRGCTQIKDGEGIFWYDLTIEPSELLKKRFDIKDSEIDRNRCVTIKVRKDDIIFLNPFDDANRTWLCIKNFRGEETELSNLGWELRKRLEESERKRRILEGETTFYSEQLKLSITNPMEFMAQPLEIIDKIKSGILEAVTKKEKEE